MYNIPRSPFAEIFSNEVKKLYLSETLADVHFQVGSSKLPAHKVILSCGSRYFRKLFNKSSEKLIEFNGSKCVLKIVLKFLYTRQLSFSPDEHLELLDLAEKFQIDDLIDALNKYSAHYTQPIADSTKPPPSKPGKNEHILSLYSEEEINHFKVTFEPLKEPKSLTIGYFNKYQISEDGQKWVDILDYSKYACGKVLEWYFPKRKIKYIKVIGVDEIKAEIIPDVKDSPEIVNNFIYPKYDVLKDEFGTIINSFEKVNENTGFVLIRLSQPYILDTLKLNPYYWNKDIVDDKLLFKEENIENSMDGKSFATVIDWSNQTDGILKILTFGKAPMFFIKITGTLVSKIDSDNKPT